MSIILLGDGTNNLTLHPKWDYKHTRKMDRADHRMYDASLYSYRFSAYDSFEFSLEGISPAQASIINNWWESRTQLNLACLIGENGVTNGFAERGNNYNFIECTYQSSFTYYDPGCFKYTQTYAWTLLTSEFIPINTNRAYHTRGVFKTDKKNTTIYAGLGCYNSSFSAIDYYHCWRAAGRDTELFAVASQGSLTVDIVPPVTSWYPPTNTVIQFNVSTTYSDLPNYNASFISSFDNTLSTSYWRLTLSPSYPCPATFAAGTRVGNTYSGSTRAYHLMPAAVTSGQWVSKIGSITGVNSYTAPPENNKFRIGTAFVRYCVLPNYNQPDTTYFSGAVVKEINGLDITSLCVVIGGNRTPFPKILFPRVDLYQGKLILEATT